MSSRPARTRLASLPPVLLGIALGAAAVGLACARCGGAPREVGLYRPRAAPEVLAAWTAQWHRRADRWRDVPDPPGEGPVVRARYWLARDGYDMEVRRRGSHFVVAIGGVADHVGGGGWTAFGEGRVDGEPGSFRGAVATFSWACLGVRFRHASDGVGRLVFDPDGAGCQATYMSWEAPDLWAKAHGRRHAPDERPPAYGTLEGQIPCTAGMPRLNPEAHYEVAVRVTDPAGAPIAGALVQVKGLLRTRVRSDRGGRCTLVFQGRDALRAQALDAGAEGYRNGEVVCFSGDDWPGWVPDGRATREVTVRLVPVDRDDHPAYVFQHAWGGTDPDDVMACGTCHPWVWDEWQGSRHARMADDAHVGWERARMRRQDPHAPDDCVGCHQPARAAREVGGSGPRPTWAPRGSAAGNTCDFCHKIAAVPDPQASGVFGSLRVARPDPAAPSRPGGIQHVFGSAPDVTYAYMGASYAAIFQSGRVCAGCHQGGGRWRDGAPPKVDTWAEWQAWTKTLPAEAVRTCLDCHMPGGVTIDERNRAVDQMAWDALHRTPAEVHDHRFRGTQPPFAALALGIAVEKTHDATAGTWRVQVRVTNVGAGHKVPTGTWSKRVLVGVWAEIGGRPLRQVAGDRTGVGGHAPQEAALAPGDWRDPGGLFLGIRAREGGGEAAFWSPWRAADLLDTRLAPGAARTATCVFEARGATEPTVEVRVLYRRAPLPAGAASVPWTLGPEDPPPEVLWARMRR